MALKVDEAVKTSLKASEEKKKRQRSPNFPAVGLPEAIERLNRFIDADGRAGAPPEIAAKHIGFASAHGLAMSVLAALKRFGLIEDRDGRVIPTQRGIEINSLPTAHEKRVKAIRDAALAPPIYAELIEQHKTTGLPHDETLEGELVAYRGFNPNGVKDFIKGFRETLEFAGLSDLRVLDSEKSAAVETPKPRVGDFVQWESNGTLRFPEAKRLIRIDETSGFAFVDGYSTGLPISEIIPAEAPQNPGQPPMHPLVRQPGSTVRVPDGVNMRQDVFSLSEGQAVLSWPTPLSQESIEDLKDWLKIVERKIARSATDSTAIKHEDEQQ